MSGRPIISFDFFDFYCDGSSGVRLAGLCIASLRGIKTKCC